MVVLLKHTIRRSASHLQPHMIKLRLTLGRATCSSSLGRSPRLWKVPEQRRRQEVGTSGKRLGGGILPPVTDLGSKGSGAAMTLRPLASGEKGLVNFNIPGGKQRLSYVTEPGLYRVLMRSDSPVARAFQDWIARDVLPAICKDAVPPPDLAPAPQPPGGSGPPPDPAADPSIVPV